MAVRCYAFADERSGLPHTGPRWIVRCGPTFRGVPVISYRICSAAPSPRCNVQRAATAKLDPWYEDVDMRHAVVVAVKHGDKGVLIGLQPRERYGLEVVEHRFDVSIGRGRRQGPS